MMMMTISCQYLNRQRTAPCLDELPTILYNMSVYLECVPLETSGGLYGPLVPQLDVLLHRLLPCLAALPELDSLLAIMCSVLKIPNVNVYKVGFGVGVGGLGLSGCGGGVGVRF